MRVSEVMKVSWVPERAFAMRRLMAAACVQVLASVCYGEEKKGPAPATAGSVALCDTIAATELGETMALP